MDKKCNSKYCVNNYKPINSDIKQDVYIQQIYCPICSANYCSEQCRQQDLQNGHSFICTVPTKKIDINANNFNNGINNSLNQSIASSTTNSSKKRNLEDYEMSKAIPGHKTELGRGSYGQVKLVKEKLSGQLFAMKLMSKKSIFQYCSVENLKREIKIQKKLQHPHITKLHHYFEDKENVYLILEYAEKGSLFHYLRKKGKFSESESFVYFFQTCLGIDYLHKKNIIHRDLKPENLLLDKDGNIKLCDFGWSAEASVQQKRTTFCGTIDYMAPEMIVNKPHNHTLDIWCLGILLFELLHGYAPFKGKNDHEKCCNIASNQKIDFDPSISSNSQDLIIKILKYEPHQRLSMKDIFSHPWMKKMEQEYAINIDQYIYVPAKQKLEKQNISPTSEENQNFNNFNTFNDKVKPLYSSNYNNNINSTNLNQNSNNYLPADNVQLNYLSNNNSSNNLNINHYPLKYQQELSNNNHISNNIINSTNINNNNLQQFKSIYNDQPTQQWNNPDLSFTSQLSQNLNNNNYSQQQQFKSNNQLLNKPQLQNTNNDLINSFNNNISNHSAYLQNEDGYKQRVSRVSQRNNVVHGQKRQQQIEDKKKVQEQAESGFFNKILGALGCINRENKEKINMESQAHLQNSKI